MLIYTSVSVFIPGSKEYRLPYVVAGISGILVSTSGLLATKEKLFFPPEYIEPGGYLGAIIWRLLGKFMGGVGSVLLLVLILLFSLMAAVRFSPLGAVQWLWRMVKGLAGVMKRLVQKKPKPKKKAVAKWQEPAVT